VPEPPGGWRIDLESQLVTVPSAEGRTKRAIILALFESQLAPLASLPLSQTYGFRSELDIEATLEELESDAIQQAHLLVSLAVPASATAAEPPDILTALSKMGAKILAKIDEQNARLQRLETQKQKGSVAASASAPPPPLASGLPLRNLEKAFGTHWGFADG
jgi:hypothetical protein